VVIMSLLACPACVADAPAEVVWSLLDPAHLDEWWDARTRRVTPQGPLSAGQRLECRAGPLGLFSVTVEVLEVDTAARRLHWVARLPFGIVNEQTTTVTPLGPGRCRISFG
jgi:hypothetical protein